LCTFVYQSQKEYDWAIEDYNTVIKLNPDNVEAYIHRGLAYHHKGEYDRAIGDFTKAIELKPNYAGPITIEV
jgi:tetratricopeptide (TPR) repeat protein